MVGNDIVLRKYENYNNILIKCKTTVTIILKIEGNCITKQYLSNHMQYRILVVLNSESLNGA